MTSLVVVCWSQCSVCSGSPIGKVHRGFLAAWLEIRDEILDFMAQFIEEERRTLAMRGQMYRTLHVYLTG